MKKSFLYPLAAIWLAVCALAAASLAGLLTREITPAAPSSLSLSEPKAAEQDHSSDIVREPPPPLTVEAQYRNDDKNNLVLVFNFNRPVINDKELIFKPLSPEEMPFAVSPPLPGTALWASAGELRLNLPFSAIELEERLSAGETQITWRLKDAYGRPIAKLGGYRPSSSFARPFEIVGLSPPPGPGQPLMISRLALQPFTAQADIKRQADGLQVDLIFNRRMVDFDQPENRLETSVMPFELTPALPFKGRWVSDRAFKALADLGREGFWAKVTGQPFTFKLKENLTSQWGEKNPQTDDLKKAYAGPFLIERFQILEMIQTGLDLEGWVYYDLMFNKPIDQGRLAAALTAERFLRYETAAAGDKAAARKEIKKFVPTQLELLGVGGPEDPYGLRARIKIKAAAGDEIRVMAAGLPSLDGRNIIKSQTLASQADSHFNIAHTRIHQEESFPWRTYFVITTHNVLDFTEIEKFVRLDPPQPFTVSAYDSEGRSLAVYAPFKLHTPIQVTLLRGLRSEKGLLTEDTSFTVTAPESASKRLRFTGRGRYLSQNKPLLVKVAGRNVSRVRLQAWRIYENNLPAIINVQDYSEGVRSRLALQFSKNVLDRVRRSKSAGGRSLRTPD